MIRLRTRKYKFFVLAHGQREAVLAWKKGQAPLPPAIFGQAVEVVGRYFQGFDLITVPAPSFHTYENYPIWDLAQVLAEKAGLPLVRLFPDQSGRVAMGPFGSIAKPVQAIDLEPGRFVLVVDDIFTTGHTLRVTCQAILNRVSFPACLALC